MIRHSRRATIVTVSAAAAILLATGCGRDLRSFSEVEAAFESPSGVLDSSTAPTVFGVSLRGQQSNSANQAATSHGQVPSTVGSAVDFMMYASGQELVSSEQALLEDCDVNVNLRNNFTVDKITFNCGDSGEYTGKLVLDFHWRGDDLEGFFLDYEMFCEGASCLDGSLGMTWSVSGSSGAGLETVFLATARFDIIQGGVTEWVDWAWRVQEGPDELRLEWLVWTSPDREGTSFVLSAVATSAGGYLEVRDATGWYRCEYGAEGRSGECFHCVIEDDECVPDETRGTVTWTTAEG
jgi:hypothetical protein